MIACLLTGQLAMAAIIDQFGLLGVDAAAAHVRPQRSASCCSAPGSRS